MRILGYDAHYRVKVGDDDLLDMAAVERRVLITRDRDLHRRALMNNLQSILLTSERLSDWLHFLEKNAEIRLGLEGAESKCSLCNSDLETVAPAEVEGQVPSGVRSRHAEFWRCPTCGKIYWHGSHWDNMRQLLENIKGNAAGS